MVGQLNNFWNQLPEGAFALAPMEDVTDTVFRELILSVSHPAKLKLLFTEFTSTDGLCHAEGYKAVVHRLKVNQSERDLIRERNVKLIVQIWGNDPEKFFRASKAIADDFQFDGIDINMGCPVNKVIRQNSCSALIGQPSLAKEIIQATIEGSGMPVSVKTRTGLKEHQTENWIVTLLESGVSAITLHARTQKMMSLFPADWEQIKIAASAVKSLKPEVKLIGNGDILSYRQGMELGEACGANGVMVGRGIFTNPWFFAEEDVERGVAEKLGMLTNHIALFHNTWGNTRNFSILKRFFKIYIHGFQGAVALRAKLMQTQHAEEALPEIEAFKLSLQNAD